MPTSVLFTPEKKFDSFGYEAEEKFANLDSRESKKWYFFQRFKLILHKDMTLATDTMLESETKKTMPALDVFSAAIGFLKKHFVEELQKQNSLVEDDDITWVLTVPAIWNDKAKDFMRRAAEKAGIPGEQLMLALEPEAASVFCVEHFKSQGSILPGKKFILADCGGGTIDLSAFKVEEKYKLRQLHRPDGTCDGGLRVDNAYKDFIREFMDAGGVVRIDKLEFFELMRAFESAKRMQATGEKISIKMPNKIKEIVESAIKMNDSDTESDSNFSHGKVRVVRNMMLLDRGLFLSFFKDPALSIPRSIKDLLTHDKVRNVDVILLAGGFSESKVIQDAVREAFPRDTVQVAPSPSAAVVTGAVMYGHNPDVITTRVSAFTYGVGTRLLFKDGVHDKARLVIGKDGKEWCKDCFSVHITIDQEVKVNTLLPYQTYTPAALYQKAMPFNIYRSNKGEPLYVDEEGSEKIGTITVLMPDTTGGMSRKVDAAMMVGGTELKLVAVDKTTGKQFTIKCDFLPKM